MCFIMSHYQNSRKENGGNVFCDQLFSGYETKLGEFAGNTSILENVVNDM